MLRPGQARKGGLDRWRRRSPATLLLAVLLTFAQLQSAFAMIANTAAATGSYGGAPVTSPTSTVEVPVAPASAALAVTKTATTANFSSVGDVVTFDILVQNTGTTSVNTITVADPTADSVTCPAGNPIATLAPAASLTCTASHTITAADVATGSYANTASASGVTPTATPVGPASNDATVARASADLVTVKTLASGDATPAVGDTVTYTITVTNNGPQAATGVSLADALPAGLTATAGNGQVSQGAYAAPAWTIGALAAGASATLTIEGVVDAGQGGQSIINTTTAATGDQGDPTMAGDELTETVAVGLGAIDAVNDDFTGVPVPPTGGATASVFGNDTLNGLAVMPAQIAVTLADAGGLTGATINADGTLTIPAGAPAGTFTLTYQICEVANPANCDSATASVTVLDNTGSIAGTVYQDADSDGALSGGDPVQGGFTVQLLQNGVVIATTTTAADGTYRFDDVPAGTGYTVAAIDPGTGATVSGAGSFDMAPGDVVADVNLPIDPSGVIYDSVTRAPIAGATVAMTTAGGTPLPAACFVAPGQQNQITGADGAYHFDILAGADPLCPAGETGYLIAVTAPAGYLAAPSTAIAPQAGALDATTCPIDATPGGSCQVQAQATAPAGAMATIYYLFILLAAGDPHVVNNHIPLDPAAAGDVTLTKVADRRFVLRGDHVLYTITATNNAAGAVAPATITDIMPAGFALVSGSATVDGVAAAPVVNGQTITFAGLTLPANGAVTITLQLEALTTAGPGKHVNTATVTGPGGVALAPAATATVDIRAEPVFDCSEVIGKVFEDRNRNGYQDEGEPGLPGVRLATVKGVLITTDKHGRFHVACADMPDARIGSNFILKLDPRTLPTGYRLTTENPRVVRLTAGKMVKMNFGAAIGRVVKLDLNAGAFEGKSTKLKAQWRTGMDELVAVLAKEESILRITYRAGAGEGDIARTRTAAIARLARELWSAQSGRYRLEIETEITAPK